MHAFKFRKLIDSREQLRLVMIAATLAFAVLLAVAPDAGAQSPDAMSDGLMVNSDCITAIMPGTEVDASSSIVMYVGPRCDTENILDEPFEFVVEADDSVAMEMHAQRSDTENIMDEEFEIAPAAPGSLWHPVLSVGEDAQAMADSGVAELVRTGLPDGSRASGIYSIDGGYGLAEPAYAELVASLLSD